MKVPHRSALLAWTTWLTCLTTTACGDDDATGTTDSTTAATGSETAAEDLGDTTSTTSSGNDSEPSASVDTSETDPQDSDPSSTDSDNGEAESTDLDGSDDDESTETDTESSSDTEETETETSAESTDSEGEDSTTTEDTGESETDGEESTDESTEDTGDESTEDGGGDDLDWLGEFEVDPPIYYEKNKASAPRVTYLDAVEPPVAVVAWQQNRPNSSGWAAPDTFVATRVARDGEVLDPGGLVLGIPGGDKRSVSALASDGSEALIVYEEIPRTDLVPILKVQSVSGKPVSEPPRKAVMVADADEFPEYSVAVAVYDGTSFVVLWYSSQGLYARRVHRGSLELGPLVEVYDAGADRGVRAPSLVTYGGRLMVGWWETRGGSTTYLFSLLDDDLQLAVAGGREYERQRPGDESFRVVEAPEGFALVHENLTGDIRTLEADLMDVDGAFVNPTALTIATRSGDSPGQFGSNTAIAGRGHADPARLRWWFSARHDGDDGNELFILNPADNSVASVGHPIPEASPYAPIHCGREGCSVGSNFAWYPRIQRLTTDGLPNGERLPVSAIAAQQSAPAVAYGDGLFGLCFDGYMGGEDDLGPGRPLIGVRLLDAEGRWRDGGPIRHPALTDTQSHCGITPVPGQGFLVTWHEYDADRERVARMRLLGSDGRWRWPAAVEHEQLVRHGQLACSTEHCVLGIGAGKSLRYLWLDLQAPENLAYRAIEVSTSNTGDDLALEMRVRAVDNPGGTGEFIMTWHSKNVYQSRRFASTGPMAGSDAHKLWNSQLLGDAEFDGSSAWQLFNGQWYLFYLLKVPAPDQPDGYYHIDLRARPYNMDGSLGPEIDFWPGQSEGTAWSTTAVEYDGEQRLHVYLWGAGDESGPEVLRAEFDADFKLLHDAAAIWPNAWFRPPPIVEGSGRNLAAYARDDWNVGFSNVRARLQFVDESEYRLETGAMCTDDGQCASGRCREAHCCVDCPLWKGR